MENELSELCLSSRHREEADTVSSGDAVIATLKSSTKKYNREKLQLVAGSNLFSRELEATLMGKAAGTCYEATVEGAPVTVTVESYLRTVLPSLTS